MAGFKETPRQKMIGMMYLVLTALLALNVSADLLNAFVIVNESMERTNTNFSNKNEALFSEFQAQYDLNKEKAGPYFDKAKIAKQESEKLIKLIQETQNKVVGLTEYNKQDARDVEYVFVDPKTKEESKLKAKEPRLVPLNCITKRDNFDAPMTVLLGVGSENGDGGEAHKIKLAIIDYKKKILNLLPVEERGSFEKRMGIDVDDKYNPKAAMVQNWELNNFAQCPMAASMILLNKTIADVLNCEADVLTILISNISKKDFKFDQIAARVIPKANIVVAGEPYEAEIFVAAYSSTESPYALIQSGATTYSGSGGTKLDEASGNVENGVVKYKAGTGGMGEMKYAGVINVKKPDGNYQAYPFASSYTVIKPTATVSADRMNVVYQGLQNPISVSAPGFTNDKVKLSVKGGGTLSSKGNGKYDFKPAQTLGDIEFVVSGSSADGKTSNLGGFKFRVKPLPMPTTRLAGAADGSTLDRSVLTIKPNVSCALENFLFDGLVYNVTSFEIVVSNQRKGTIVEQVNSSKIPQNVIDKMKSFPPGSKVMISQVKVVGPNGPGRATSFSLILN